MTWPLLHFTWGAHFLTSAVHLPAGTASGRDRHYITAVEGVNTATSDTHVLMGVAQNATFSLNLLPLGHRAGPSPGPLGWRTGPHNSVLDKGTCPFSLAPRLLDLLSITSPAASLS